MVGTRDRTSVKRPDALSAFDLPSESFAAGQTHLKVGIDLSEPPGLAPTAYSHPRKLLDRIVDIPSRFPFALTISRLLPFVEERVERWESSSGRDARTQSFQTLPNSVGLVEGGEVEVVDEEVASAEDERCW